MEFSEWWYASIHPAVIQCHFCGTWTLFDDSLDSRCWACRFEE